MGADERKHYRRGFALHLCIVVSGLSPACDTPLERRSRAGIRTLRHSHVHNVQIPPEIGKPWERRSRRIPSRSRPQPDRKRLRTIMRPRCGVVSWRRDISREGYKLLTSDAIASSCQRNLCVPSPCVSITSRAHQLYIRMMRLEEALTQT